MIDERSTKEEALEYLNTCSLLEVKNMKYLKPELRDDPEVVKTAVKNHGFALRYASERLQDDPEVVKIAVKKNGWTLQFASERLKDDPEIVTIAVKNNGMALVDASTRLKDDPEIVTAAVTNEGCALNYASKRLQALGIDGVIELPKEQKRNRQIQRSRIDIKNKRLID